MDRSVGSPSKRNKKNVNHVKMFMPYKTASSAYVFCKFLSKKYENIGDREMLEIGSLLESYPFMSITERLIQLRYILKDLVLKSNANTLENESHFKTETPNATATYKSKQIITLSEMSIHDNATLLDVGAGSGDVISVVMKSLNIPKERAFAIDVAGGLNNNLYTVLTYGEKNRIPLEDNQVDIVILTHVLHHIHPDDRLELLKDIRRVLKPNGKVVVQEHDDDKSTKLYYDIDLYHLYWSATTKHPVDELHLMSRKELESLFVDAGFTMKIRLDAVGWQRMFWSSYIVIQDNDSKKDPLIVSSSSDTALAYRLSTEYQLLESLRKEAKTRVYHLDNTVTRFTKDSPRLPYAPGFLKSEKEKIGIHWGQLKLFVEHLRFILENWKPDVTPRITIVYAGAAHGYNLKILDSMFNGIQWELYDPSEFGIERSNTIHLHTDKNGMFTDDVAKEWSARNNVFFLSDIRSSDYTEKEEGELEEDIKNDMLSQQRWVEIIKPVAASLKFRLPFYIEGKDQHFDYLAGNIVPQAFGLNGTEARLEPLRNSEGLYHNVTYDVKEFEDVSFYFNAVTRHSKVFQNPLIESKDNELYTIDDSTGLDNHFDSVFFLNVLKKYELFRDAYPRIARWKNNTAMEMSTTIRERLGQMVGNKDLTINSLRLTSRD